MKANYIRVSTLEQNTARQKESIVMGAKVYEDKESGSIPFAERRKGKELIQDVKEGKITEVHVHSIDRLGRSTIDILNTIQFFSAKGVNVVSVKEGLQTFIEGKENPIAKMMIGILSTLSEFELSRTKERQAEGIAKAKERKVYINNGGNKQKESIGEFMLKPKTKKVIKFLSEGNSLRRTAKLAECSLGTVQKVQAILDQKNELKDAYNHNYVPYIAE